MVYDVCGCFRKKVVGRNMVVKCIVFSNSGGKWVSVNLIMMKLLFYIVIIVIVSSKWVGVSVVCVVIIGWF